MTGALFQKLRHPPFEIRVKSLSPWCFIFTLPESDTFLPNRVGRRAIQPGSAMAKVKITSVYRVEGAPEVRFFEAPGIIQNPDFSKNKTLASPEFLFSRRITIFQVAVLFSRRRGGDLAVDYHWQPATQAVGAL